MKLIVQVGILFGICWASQWVEQLLPFTMPASIIGMVMLLGLLALGIVRTEHIREKSDFLLGNLPFFFVPAPVSMMSDADVLKSTLAALAVICVVSTVVTFAATVWAVRLTVRLSQRRKP